LIRADTQRFKRGGGSECPFAQQLEQQPQGRNQYRGALCVQVFLDPKYDVSFAGTTGNDKLATVGGLQPLHNGGSGISLMVAWFGTSFALGLRECFKVGGIVQCGAFKIEEQKTDDELFLRFIDLPGIAANKVCSGNQQAMLDARPVRFANRLLKFAPICVAQPFSRVY